MDCKCGFCFGNKNNTSDEKNQSNVKKQSNPVEKAQNNNTTFCCGKRNDTPKSNLSKNKGLVAAAPNGASPTRALDPKAFSKIKVKYKVPMSKQRTYYYNKAPPISEASSVPGNIRQAIVNAIADYELRQRLVANADKQYVLKKIREPKKRKRKEIFKATYDELKVLKMPRSKERPKTNSTLASPKSKNEPRYACNAQLLAILQEQQQNMKDIKQTIKTLQKQHFKGGGSQAIDDSAFLRGDDDAKLKEGVLKQPDTEVKSVKSSEWPSFLRNPTKKRLDAERRKLLLE